MESTNRKNVKTKRSFDSNEDGHIGWRELDFRDKVAYIMSVVLMTSGILMAFACFFMTDDHNVTDGVLFYTAESFTTGGALLGIGIYVKNKFGEMNSYIHKKLDNNE